MRKYIERLSTSKKAIAVVVTAVAGLAMTGCSSDKESEWVFAVTCPEEQDVLIGDVTTGYKSANIIVECGNDEASSAPISVELLDGDGVTIKEPANEGLQTVTLGYQYSTNMLVSQNPEIGAIKIDEEGGFAQIILRDMSITEVSVSGNSR